MKFQKQIQINFSLFDYKRIKTSQPSAILYKWCHHLLKDNIYEGRGGFLFVRYESNSILQLLYPCSRYSPNKCMICGGSAPDHLELWWSKHNLYSPFDQYLDKTYHDALMIDDEDVVHAVSTDVGDASSVNRKRGRFRNKSPPSIRTTPTIMTGPPSFAFHKRYVEDVSDIVNGVNDPKEQINLIKKKLTSLQSGMNYRIKRAPVTGVTYLSPGINRRRNDKKNYTKKDTFIDMLSIIALGRIEDLILDQAIEFEHRRRRHSRLGNRF
mmetsp:Transcript_47712/g.51570  ORF Transcript_47712/g.51570 Transcript_47712/m.51570 type:complete len:268 (+) Transcript_47712:300-1103(+)